MKSGSYLERAEIEGRFSDSAKRNFGDKLSLLISSGSFAYLGAQKGKSDLDVMAVLKDEIYRTPRKEVIEMIAGFVADYHRVHKDYEYSADEVFPGEYITESNAEDALLGRGMHTNDGRLYLPPASNAYYLSNQEHYYRAWQSQLAFSRRIDGDASKFLETKLRAWELIIKFIVSNADGANIDPASILRYLTNQEDKWSGVGVTKKCVTFAEDELPFVEQAFQRLRVQELLLGDEKAYKVNVPAMNEWRLHVTGLIGSGALKRSAFLTNQDDETEITSTATGKIRASVDAITLQLENPKFSVAPMKNAFLGECIQIVYSATAEEETRDGMTDSDIIILIKSGKNPLSNVSSNGKLISKDHFGTGKILMRVSSACTHGFLGDAECSCRADTEDALREIAKNGAGVFIYMPQDAQGRGLRDKVRDHRLIYGVDRFGKPIPARTMDESMAVIHPEGYDIRNYHVLRGVLTDLGLDELDFTFIGNNHEKLRKIQAETGMRISSTISLNGSNS